MYILDQHHRDVEIAMLVCPLLRKTSLSIKVYCVKLSQKTVFLVGSKKYPRNVMSDI